MLKIRHSYLKNYLYQIGKTTNDRCRCRAKETAEHLLFRCPEYLQTRLKLLDGHTTMSGLLETKEGLNHLLAFIRETKIATRAWHLARNEDDNNEEEEV